MLMKACGPSGHSGHLLKLAKAPSGHSGHLLKLAKHLLDILDNWREPLAPKGVLGRFCDYRCVVARWPSRSVVPCRPRPRGPRTPWVRLNSNRRCGVRARQSRRLGSASTAAAKVVSCSSPRGLEAPRARTEVSTIRSDSRRPARARSCSHLFTRTRDGISWLLRSDARCVLAQSSCCPAALLWGD